MTVPNDIHHRRRIVFSVLQDTLKGDVRAYVLFMLWDKHYRSLSGFPIAPLCELGVKQGLLMPEEERSVKRDFFNHLRVKYEDLPPYPSGLVREIKEMFRQN